MLPDPAFYMASGGSNGAPHVCMAITLSTVPSPFLVTDLTHNHQDVFFLFTCRAQSMGLTNLSNTYSAN